MNKPPTITLDRIQKMIQKNHEAGYYSRNDLPDMLHVSRYTVYYVLPYATDTRLSWGMNGKPVTYYNEKEIRTLVAMRSAVTIHGAINIALVKNNSIKRMILNERHAKTKLIGSKVTVLINDTNEVIKRGTLEFYNMVGFIVDGETFHHTSSELFCACRLKELD